MAVSELEQVAWRCFYASAQQSEFANSNFTWRGERREGDSMIDASSRKSFCCTFKSWLLDDYYGLLALEEDASVEVVVKHIKKLLVKHIKKLLEMHHPD